MTTTLPVGEFRQLKKLMGMTGSAQDGEALNAIRLANGILAKHKLSWSDVFERLVTVDVEAAIPYPRQDGDSPGEKTARERFIDEQFSALREGGRWNDFIGSLYEQWEKRSWLSQPQREALTRNVERMRDDPRR